MSTPNSHQPANKWTRLNERNQHYLPSATALFTFFVLFFKSTKNVAAGRNFEKLWSAALMAKKQIIAFKQIIELEPFVAI